ncbi:MarR family winged helix-turn-helix transcriptional regulator [Paracrocinitomix mangrovi]|uniref:MarR family winged helix-turn-helix transcriptional regulator n=1 Tax=Paracrocinitomix mangrovi TaxID=2862509 RepID=UPI001C8D491F|nr:MarR family winged helix-turn-helix transcriptional regulator [Paracrocinitomix mangrovi]UKN00270.1 MarR family winged helix-turn-helix transcriptional regulator [Paracrocinitomix mangrovi]
MEYTDVLISIRKIARAINLDSKRIQKQSGLSIPQLLSLTFVSHCPDYQCAQIELRKYLQLNSSTVTGIVSRLIEKGYLAKIPSKGDKRSTWITLTAAGFKQLENTPELFQDRLNEKLKELPDSDIKLIQTGLDKLIGLLGKEELSGSLS